MRNQFDRSFSGEPPHIKRVPGSPRSGQLLGDEVLETLLNRLEKTAPDHCYPLQLSFYEKLLKCDLLLPVPVGTQLDDGLPLLTLENARGEIGLPVFTNEANLAQWGDEPTEYVILPFSKLCGYAIEAQVDFVIVNVSGPHGCEIALRDFSYLAESLLPPPMVVSSTGKINPSTLPVDVKAGTPTRLGLPKPLPEELLGQLKHVFSSHTALIDRVYQFEIAFNEGPLQPALGMLLQPEGPAQSNADWEKSLLPNVQAVLFEMLEPRMVMNVFLLNETPSLEKQIRKLCAPLYKSSAKTGDQKKGK
jgi:hypothetical protein